MIDAQMTTTPVCPTPNPYVCSFPQGQILVIDANGKSTPFTLNSSGKSPFPMKFDSSASAASPVYINAGLENTPVQRGWHHQLFGHAYHSIPRPVARAPLTNEILGSLSIAGFQRFGL
jgi:hypothetical protein